MNTTTFAESKSLKTNAVYSLTPFTLLDYPNHSACIIWFTGCNMRCLYCYNPEIVLGKPTISFEKVFSFLESRKKLLDAVVFSGGECLLHKNIIDFIDKIKQMGFLVKIDTNGSKPEVLQKLIKNNLIDYVALDFKAMENDFEKITKSNLFQPFEKSLKLLLEIKIDFEVRTTVHSDLIDTTKLQEMIRYLENKNYHGNYYIQHFVNGVSTLGNLAHSSNKTVKKGLDTPKIKVCFRN